MRKLGKGVVILPMIIITAAGQILTLVKSTIVAGMFGATTILDAYNFANSIATFIFGFVTAGITSIILPEYSKKKDIRSINTFITVLYLVIGILLAFMILLRFPIMNLMTGKESVFKEVAAECLIILLLSQLMGSVSSITVAYFHCKEKFLLPKVIHLVSQLFVVGFLFFCKHLSIIEYGVIIAIGSAINFIVDTTLAVKAGWRFKVTFLFSDETKRIFKCFVPIIFSTGVYNLSHLVDSVLATFIGTGGITVLGYSSQVALMVNTIIITNLHTYVYPKIIKNIYNNGKQSFFWDITTVLHAICCLMVVGFFVVGRDGVELLLFRGKFTLDNCNSVFIGAFIYIFGQQTNCIRSLIYQYFYATGDTLTPAKNSVMVTILNLTISFVLVFVIGFYGIILGTVLASVISLCLIMYHFRRKIGFYKSIWLITREYFGNMTIMIVTMLLLWALKRCIVIDDCLVRILVWGLLTVVVYCALQYIINGKKYISTIKSL